MKELRKRTNKRKNAERTANCRKQGEETSSVVRGKRKVAKRKKTGIDSELHYINITILSLLRRQRE